MLSDDDLLYLAHAEYTNYNQTLHAQAPALHQHQPYQHYHQTEFNPHQEVGLAITHNDSHFPPTSFSATPTSSFLEQLNALRPQSHLFDWDTFSLSLHSPSLHTVETSQSLPSSPHLPSINPEDSPLLSSASSKPATKPKKQTRQRALSLQNHHLPNMDHLKAIHPAQLNKALKCPAPGCIKSYKNRGGLRYHLIHVHPELRKNSKVKVEEADAEDVRELDQD